MRCPKCGTESNGPVCPVCGTQLPSSSQTVICPRCSTPHSLARCPVCGFLSPLYAGHSAQVRQSNAGLLGMIWNVSMMLMLILFVIDIAALVYSSMTLIMPELVAGSLTEQPIFTIFPTLAALFYLTGTTTILVYFILILAAILFTYIYLLLADGKGLLRLIASPISSVLPRLRSRNRWVMVAQLFLAVIFFQFAYTALLNGLGIQTNPPPGLEEAPTWYLMFDLANASVFEEVVSRLALIGFPLFVGSFLMRFMSLRYRHPDAPFDTRGDRRYLMGSLRYLIGGNMDRRSPKPAVKLGALLTLVSAVFFGFAHEGWGDWKLFPAFVAGLAFGYVFLRGGFVAAVLLHFAVDYFAAASILVQDDLSLLAFLGFLLYALVFLGVGFLLYYIIYGYNLLVDIFGSRRPTTLVPSPAMGGTGPAPFGTTAQGSAQIGSPQQYSAQTSVPPFAATCPYCSWPESRFVDGRLVCSNCGRTR